MQIKDDFISWSPTTSTRLLKCFIVDAAKNTSKIYQLDFIQAFIQSKATKRMFVILDKEYSLFCPKLAQLFGKEFMSLDTDKYVKNIISRFKKSFKHPFKRKDFPSPISFIPTRKDCPTTEEQMKETKARFGNLHYRSVIGALLYESCCTRPDICFAVNKLAKYANNPGVVHFRALLHLIGFLKNTSNKGLRFYSKIESSCRGSSRDTIADKINPYF